MATAGSKCYWQEHIGNWPGFRPDEGRGPAFPQPWRIAPRVPCVITCLVALLSAPSRSTELWIAGKK